MGVGFERGGQQLGFECWIRRKKETSLMFLSKLDSKDTEECLFFRIERGDKGILGLFLTSA